MSLSDKLRSLSLPESFRPRPEILTRPTIPLPMSGVCPRAVLGKDWWDRVRRLAYRSTQFRCAACGVEAADAKEKPQLEGHELFDIDYLMGRMTYVETVPLCHYCHCFCHRGRLLRLTQDKKSPPEKLVAVVQHGMPLLRGSGLSLQEPYAGPTVEWGEWRMILADREYPPRYRSLQELEHAFSSEEADAEDQS